MRNGRDVFAYLILTMTLKRHYHNRYTATVELFKAAANTLTHGGCVYLYGPFREPGSGEYGEHNDMKEGNFKFDLSLKSRDPSWGIRSLQEVSATATEFGFEIEPGDMGRVEMPSNNLFISFKKTIC